MCAAALSASVPLRKWIHSVRPRIRHRGAKRSQVSEKRHAQTCLAFKRGVMIALVGNPVKLTLRFFSRLTAWPAFSLDSSENLFQLDHVRVGQRPSFLVEKNADFLSLAELIDSTRGNSQPFCGGRCRKQIDFSHDHALILPMSAISVNAIDFCRHFEGYQTSSERAL